MSYADPSLVTIKGVANPLRHMTAKEASIAYHIIDENGLTGVLEVKEDYENGMGYQIRASWADARCISLTAMNWAFASNLANIFDAPEMKEIGFKGAFDIKNNDLASTSQHLVINGGVVTHFDTTPASQFNYRVPQPDKETVVQPFNLRR